MPYRYNPLTNKLDYVAVSPGGGGGQYKTPATAATVADLNALYDNGSSGIGATLTNNGALAALVVDGVSLSLNDRVLVKDQSNAFDYYHNRFFENDSNGNPIYAGFSAIPNAVESELVWFVKKIYYDSNQSVLRVQMPDDGVKFAYSWTDRATYFS